MKNLFPILFLLFFLNITAQEVPIWKEMNKEFEDCGSSLKLYEDGTFFYEKFCEGMRFSFCMGSWENRNSLIHLNPRIKESFTMNILKEEKVESDGVFKLIDINNKPISGFDFIEFPGNVTVEEAVADMDDYVNFTGKVSLTEISMPIDTFEDGYLEMYSMNKEYQLMAYDLYQISGEIIVFNIKDILNTAYTVRVNLPAEIFQYSDLNYIELPSKYIQLEEDNYKFVSKPD